MDVTGSTFFLPEELVTYDSAGGDPFLIYFPTMNDRAWKWLDENTTGDCEILDQGTKTHPNDFELHQVWFQNPDEAYAFICRWYDDADLFTIGDSDALGALQTPIGSTPHGLHCTRQATILWGQND